MTAVYGMNGRLGTVSFPRKDEQQFDKPYSDATAQVIDEEVRLVRLAFFTGVWLLLTHGGCRVLLLRLLVSTAYQRTKALLEEHATQLKQARATRAERLSVSDVVFQVPPPPSPTPGRGVVAGEGDDKPERHCSHCRPASVAHEPQAGGAWASWGGEGRTLRAFVTFFGLC